MTGPLIAPSSRKARTTSDSPERAKPGWSGVGNIRLPEIAPGCRVSSVRTVRAWLRFGGNLITRMCAVLVLGTAVAASMAGCGGSAATTPAARTSQKPSSRAQGALAYWIIWGDGEAGSNQNWTVFQGTKKSIYQAYSSQFKISGPYYSYNAAYSAARHGGSSPSGNPNYLTEPAISTKYGPVSGSCLATLRSDTEPQLQQVADGMTRPADCPGVKNGALLDAAIDIGQQKWQNFGP